jgi:O-antigen/teichoic acid export membrane protein
VGEDTVVAAGALTEADLGRAARSSALSVAGAVASAVLGAVFTVLVTRGVPPSAAGTFFAVTSVFLLLLAVARLGTGTGIVYFFTRHRVLGSPSLLWPTLRTAAVPVVVAAGVLGAGLFAAAPLVSSLLGAGGAGVLPLRVLAVFVPLAAVSDLCLAAAWGCGQVRPLVVVDRIGRPALQVLGALVAIGTGWAASVALPVAWAGPYLASAVVAVVWLRRLMPDTGGAGVAGPDARGLPGPGPDARDLPESRAVSGFWAFTAPRALGSIAQIALQRLDVVLLAALAGPVEAAVYTAATRFLVFGQLGGQAVSTGVQHRFGTLFALGDRAAAGELYRTATAWLILLTWPLYLLFALYSPYVLAIFGRDYTAGEPVMVLLALTMLVATGCGMVDNVLNMAGRTTWTLANAVLALVVNVGLDLLLIPRLGILGAAIAWAAAIAVNNLVPLAQLRWWLGLHPFGPGTAVAGALALLAFGAVPGVAALALGRSLPVLVGATVAGAVLYASGAWAARETLRLTALRALRRQG